MRFVATADWQLGMPGSFLPDEARARFAQARIDVVRRIGEVAAEYRADFVVVAGDVFDSNQLHRSVVARAFDALADWPVPVYLLPGNHDCLDAASIYRSAEFTGAVPDGVRVLDAPGVYEATEGVELVAAPWFGKRPLTDLVADVLADLPESSGRRRVLIGHGGLLGIDRDDPAAIDLSALTSALTDRRIDVAILGDRHSTTEVADRLWYPGAPEVTRHRETDPGQVLVVDLDEHSGGVEITPVRVGRWSFLTHEAPMNGDTDLDDLERDLDRLPDKHLTVVRLTLTGTLTIPQRARLDELLARAADRFAHVFVWQRRSELAVRGDAADFGELGLTGFAADAVAELTEELNGPTAEEAADARGLLYRLTGAAEAGR